MKLENATIWGILGFLFIFIFKILGTLFPLIYSNHLVFITGQVIYLICLIFILLFFRTIASNGHFKDAENIKPVSSTIFLFYGLLIFFQIIITLKPLNNTSSSILVFGAIIHLIIDVLLFVFFLFFVKYSEVNKIAPMILPSYLASIWAIFLFIGGIFSYSYLFFKKQFISNNSITFLIVNILIMISFIFLFYFLLSFHKYIAKKRN